MIPHIPRRRDFLKTMGLAATAVALPGALRAALREDPAQPSLADVQFALTQLGTVACAKNRTARCPLGDACPRRADYAQTLD